MITILTKYSPSAKTPSFNRWVFFIVGACLLFWSTLFFVLIYPSHSRQPSAVSNSLATLIPIQQTLELRGSLIAHTSKDFVYKISYVIAQGSAGTPTDMANNSVVINYRDTNQRLRDLTWQWEFLEPHDQDTLLEAGELVRLTVPLTESLVHPLPPNTAFVLDIIPKEGTILSLKSKTPTQFDTNTELTLR